MKTQYLFILFISFIFFPSIVDAQKVHKVKGIFKIKIENNMTREQTVEKAEDLAMIDAIEKTFGTYVEQEADINVVNGTVSYNIIGSTKVKGEWLRTTSRVVKDEIQEQVNNDKNKEKTTWIICTVEGEAREIHPMALLNISTLRCPSLDCETTAFKDLQNFFLYFKSPVDGYLSVFIDEGQDTTRRLFPYLNQGNTSAVKIEGDKPYFLFSNTNNLNKFKERADRIVLFAYSNIDYNNIYIVFSPTIYFKPILSNTTLIKDGYTLPKAISTKDFLEWLGACRVAMPDFQVKRIKISISKK